MQKHLEFKQSYLSESEAESKVAKDRPNVEVTRRRLGLQAKASHLVLWADEILIRRSSRDHLVNDLNETLSPFAAAIRAQSDQIVRTEALAFKPSDVSRRRSQLSSKTTIVSIQKKSEESFPSYILNRPRAERAVPKVINALRRLNYNVSLLLGQRGLVLQRLSIANLHHQEGHFFQISNAGIYSRNVSGIDGNASETLVLDSAEFKEVQEVLEALQKFQATNPIPQRMMLMKIFETRRSCAKKAVRMKDIHSQTVSADGNLLIGLLNNTDISSSFQSSLESLKPVWERSYWPTRKFELVSMDSSGNELLKRLGNCHDIMDFTVFAHFWEENFETFLKGLSKLRYIRSLTFNTSWNAMSDQACKLIPPILKSSKCLNQFTVILNENLEITEKGLLSLAEGISSAPLLTLVHLDLCRCLEITDSGVSKLMRALADHKRLTSLYLGFTK
eukprot:TRINITY_DN775_c0_g2_i1.p1 TRINITY_DN775_c0_g2~~TRINITY_DN775_c0_g2_i1.p1  ORF type:complete len:447 (-),score=77.12 TRINITY_DN775_c0_g2_i1:105-1445(-)